MTNDMRKLMETVDSLYESTLPTVEDLIRLFTKVNQDIENGVFDLPWREGPGKDVVPLTDVDFYAHEIANIYELDDKTARKLAIEMRKQVIYQNTIDAGGSHW